MFKLILGDESIQCRQVKKLPQNLMGFCWIENKRNLHWNVAYYLNSLLPCGPTESFPLLNLVNFCFSLWNNEKTDKLSGLAIFTVNSEPPVLLIFEPSTLDNLPFSKGLNPRHFWNWALILSFFPFSRTSSGDNFQRFSVNQTKSYETFWVPMSSSPLLEWTPP